MTLRVLSRPDRFCFVPNQFVHFPLVVLSSRCIIVGRSKAHTLRPGFPYALKLRPHAFISRDSRHDKMDGE